ncbi:MAG: acyl-CoA reductase [Lachnospiraceae bacterium]|nr:acyl-CoA reductase [Lachnospiraceae bacterium]
MILYGGETYPSDQQDRLLSDLEKRIDRTLCGEGLSRETVISTVDRLAERIEAGEFDELINSFAPDKAQYYKETAVRAMKRETAHKRLAIELPEALFSGCTERLNKRVFPLGVLFHIAAGNAEGLPALSVYEGLLTGNINILKLPSADNGLTLTILRELIRMEPALADYIYVFDTPSTDLEAMKKMAELSDGIAVWGGETAVSAVRALAKPGTRLIEWGHRLSFAYISGYADKETELRALAEHIASTGQILCSSCQVIYLDIDRLEEAEEFCRDFLPVLDAAAEKYLHLDIGEAAQLSVRRYCEGLERAAGYTEKSKKRFNGKNSSLTICKSSTLELSDMYANVLVKRLPEKHILPVLRRTKSLLQTAGLICRPESRDRLTETLLRAGVNRVTLAGSMSVPITGEVHDGEYALRRYVRVTDTENC